MVWTREVTLSRFDITSNGGRVGNNPRLVAMTALLVIRL